MVKIGSRWLSCLFLAIMFPAKAEALASGRNEEMSRNKIKWLNNTHAPFILFVAIYSWLVGHFWASGSQMSWHLNLVYNHQRGVRFDLSTNHFVTLSRIRCCMADSSQVELSDLVFQEFSSMKQSAWVAEHESLITMSLCLMLE